MYRISDVVLGVMANVFYIEKGFSIAEIATYSKFFGTVATIVGGVIGGLASVHLGVMRSLFIGALISALSVINSNFQVALMAPTEILARQHYTLAKKLFPENISIELLSSKSENIDKKRIINELKNNKIKMIFGTHAIFQKKILFNKLGYIIIDEQHKFGVRQRKLLSDKGGDNCDVLLMSATPIPRTLTMSVYGDMDVSIIREKPSNTATAAIRANCRRRLWDGAKYPKNKKAAQTIASPAQADVPKYCQKATPNPTPIGNHKGI